MYAYCYDNVNDYLFIDSLVDYQNNDKALLFEDQNIFVFGWSYINRSVAGWKLCVQWKDGSTSWKYPRNLKES